MDKLLSARNRQLILELMSRSYASADQAAADICQLVKTTIGVDVVFASRLTDTTLEITAAADGLGVGVQPGMALPLEQTFCARALAGVAPHSTSDLSQGPYADLDVQRQIDVRSYAMTPLRNEGGVPTGTLCMLNRERREFDETALALLELLGGILAREQALDRSRTRQAEQAADLAFSDRRYRTLVDDLGDLVVEIDASGRITYVNRSFTALTGLTVEQMAGRDVMDHVHPEDRDMAAEHMAAALSGSDTIGRDTYRVARFFAADGSVRWMNVRGRPQLDEGGNLTGFVGILHDITGQVLAEQQVRRALAEAEAARDEAQRASRAKSEFLSRMSHELRTPLHAILGFGQLLEMADLADEDGESVDQILKAGRHLLGLINEVLDVVRIEAGTLSLSLEAVDVDDVVAESVDLVRVDAAARGITLHVPPQHASASVTADRQRLKQILINLLSNAVKYNRDDGEVALTCTRLPIEEQPPEPPPEHGWLRLAVRDTGRGIPADRLDDVFTPFDRLGAEATDVEGTGVGLSLTKTLVEAIGGRIGLTSTLGEGSMFWVDLPAAAAFRERPPQIPQQHAPSATVLYVEDNPANIMLLRRVLARRPHLRLVVVTSGAEAVETIRATLPDFVLLDLHLPEQDVEEILARLRGDADSRLQRMPVVIVSADLSAGTEQRLLDAGASLFLPKPIDVSHLLSVIDEHLPAGPPRRALDATA